MAIGERYEGILKAACDVIARRGFHQASIREIARAAGLSLAGLYHYVGGKDELLFLVLDRSLDRLLASLDRGARRRRARPETRLLALIRTHLDFGFHHAAALKIINRDWELLRRAAARRDRRQAPGLPRAAASRCCASSTRTVAPEDELLSATNLLLGMLNGIATRPFLRSPEDARALAAEVGALFLYGFLERSRRAARTFQAAALRRPA